MSLCFVLYHDMVKSEEEDYLEAVLKDYVWIFTMNERRYGEKFFKRICLESFWVPTMICLRGKGKGVEEGLKKRYHDLKRGEFFVLSEKLKEEIKELYLSTPEGKVRTYKDFDRKGDNEFEEELFKSHKVKWAKKRNRKRVIKDTTLELRRKNKLTEIAWGEYQKVRTPLIKKGR